MTKFALMTILTALSFVSYGQISSESKKQILYSAKEATHFDVLTKKATLTGDVKLVLDNLHLKGSVIEVDFLNNKIVAKSSPVFSSSPIGYNNNSTMQADPIIVITNLDGYSFMPLASEGQKE